jgi:tetratricopeptide (TPR) repeat protein
LSIIEIASIAKQSKMKTSSSNHVEDVVVRKPFFVMDWLEEMISDQDVEKISEMLQTPQKKPKQLTPKSSNRNRKKSIESSSSLSSPSNNSAHKRLDKQLFPADITSPSKSTSTSSKLTPPRHPTSMLNKTPPKESPFYKKSIQIGNGWNAKGLKKAKQGLWGDALACWDNALEIRSQVLGDSHLDVANTYNNRGIALGKLGKWESAVESLEKALEIRTKVGVQGSSIIHNIANVHHQAGDFERAIQLFCYSKHIQQQADPGKANRLQVQCIAIGNIYYEALQYRDAREAYLDALEGYRSAGLLSNDPKVLEVQRDVQDLDRLIELQYQEQQQQQQQQQASTIKYSNDQTMV